MSYLHTQTDHRGVTTLTLSRAENLNALNRAFIDEFTLTLQSLNSNTRILLIDAKGKHFCAGADVHWMKASAQLSDDENHDDALALSKLLHTLDTLNCPTIARVQGAALGGGTGLVCCCDIVVACESAQFAFSEVRLGIVPATISPYAIATIGARAARRYFLTGEKIDAVEAYRLGLVHNVCSTDNLDRRVGEHITELLKASPEAQKAAKELISFVNARPIDPELRQQLGQRLATIRTSAGAQEGLSAFLEKRAPNWTT